MANSYFVIFLTVITLSAVIVTNVYSKPPGTLECPMCTDPQDPTSCTEIVTCKQPSATLCELAVNTTDANSVEYKCRNNQACTKHETFECGPDTEQDLCFFCCSTVDACTTQRINLFSTTFSTMAPTNATTSNTTSTVI